MENQHRKITGYRELTAEEIALMNEVKQFAVAHHAMLAKIAAHVAKQYEQASQEERERLNQAQPLRWHSIATTHAQESYMALVRAIAQPTTF